MCHAAPVLTVHEGSWNAKGWLMTILLLQFFALHCHSLQLHNTVQNTICHEL